MEHAEIQALGLENEVNLCDSCCHAYPNCADDKLNIIFGTGNGSDNVCSCNKYEALSFRHPSQAGEL